MNIIDGIMALKDHSSFKYIHGKKKNNAFFSKISVDVSRIGVDLDNRMQIGGDMNNSWIMFECVKYLKEFTILVCHV